MKCYWCSNPESQDGKPEDMWDNQKKAVTTVGEYKTLDEIIEEVMKDEPFYEESGGGVTYLAAKSFIRQSSLPNYLDN